jgi:hypothetical protein
MFDDIQPLRIQLGKLENIFQSAIALLHNIAAGLIVIGLTVLMSKLAGRLMRRALPFPYLTLTFMEPLEISDPRA